MTRLLGVYGAGGCGRTVMAFLRDANPGVDCVFIDDAPLAPTANGHAVVTWDRFLAMPGDRQVCVAIARSALREALALKSAAAGVVWAGCIARQALVLDGAQLGAGAIISPFATIGANVVAGRGALVDLYACVNHDCRLGDFVTLAPYANVNGNVDIGDHAYIGSGALIRQGQPGKPLVIGRGAVVGMGAVVTHDVAAGVTVVGNPARPIVKG